MRSSTFEKDTRDNKSSFFKLLSLNFFQSARALCNVPSKNLGANSEIVQIANSYCTVIIIKMHK